MFTPVPSWGKHGWTFVHLQFADADTVRSALTTSWRNVAPKKLIDSKAAAKA